MVEAAHLPLEHVLGPELGAFYRDVHADHGVEWHLGNGVAELRGSPGPMRSAWPTARWCGAICSSWVWG